MDAMSQFASGADLSTFDYGRNLALGTLGAATGVYGTGLANTAVVTPISLMNINSNMKNAGGLVIFGNQFMINQAGSQAIKSANPTPKD